MKQWVKKIDALISMYRQAVLDEDSVRITILADKIEEVMLEDDN